MTKTIRLRPPMGIAEEAAMDRGPLLAEAVVSAIHSSHDSFTLSIAFKNGKVALFASGSEEMLPLIRQQLYAQYPESEITEEKEEEAKECLTRELILEKPDLLPIKTYPAFVDHETRRLV